ncbi:MAG TPA: hypothetical protein VFN67_21495 [Polyangiales bacterium]|nr:hypothetical protein [Polyangiales bacterium]
MRLEAQCQMQLSVDKPTPLIAMLRPRSGEGQWVVSETYEMEPFVPVTEYTAGHNPLSQMHALWTLLAAELALIEVCSRRSRHIRRCRSKRHRLRESTLHRRHCIWSRSGSAWCNIDLVVYQPGL